MRLIEAGTLLERIKEEPTDGMYTQEIIDIIDAQPTAYDVDKVVEQLENEIELVSKDYYMHGRYIKKNRAIDIVKAGGVDD